MVRVMTDNYRAIDIQHTGNIIISNDPLPIKKKDKHK